MAAAVPGGRRGARYVEVRRRPARPGLARPRARARAEAASRSRTCRTCSARSTRSPRSSRRAHDAGALRAGRRRAGRAALRASTSSELGADFYGFTGHKVYGPTGIGVLYGRRELLEEMPPFLGGGDMIASVDFQESRWNSLPWKFEAGTTPYAEAAGLGAAVDWLAGLGIDDVVAHERDLTAYALERLAEVPGLRVYRAATAGDTAARAVSFALEGVHPHDVAEILARDDICIRAGHHCAQPLMRRLGVPATSRASFGVHNTRADVDRLVDGARRRCALSSVSRTAMDDALPGVHPRALQAPAQLGRARRRRPRVRGQQPALRRRAEGAAQGRRRRARSTTCASRATAARSRRRRRRWSPTRSRA